ncbi:light-harvesting protein [Roseovarius faecimaris]|uniref:Antenna pigment protein alpha chain n=1 Tax=Roseovarius faecimaris TaxID=2494550 RepID=A0A6I6IR25_9RHOB|nr:light-harvesting protein [Roseovarius faecimaris]QGX99529.1 light-harvesting protein [Roseovarius faecimaris]
MNNAKMWLVVKPTVGIPLFLSAVAVSSFAVHVAVLSNTSWVSDYLSGQPIGAGDQTAAMTQEKADTAKVNYVVPSQDGSGDVTLILSDGTVMKAVLERPETTLASVQTLQN